MKNFASHSDGSWHMLELRTVLISDGFATTSFIICTQTVIKIRCALF